MIRLAAALIALAACTDDGGPHLASVTPFQVPAGGVVTVTGERLCGESGDCSTAGGAIRIGYDHPVQAMILDYADTAAQLRIPSITPLGETVLIATVNERSSNALAIEIIGPL